MFCTQRAKKYWWKAAFIFISLALVSYSSRIFPNIKLSGELIERLSKEYPKGTLAIILAWREHLTTLNSLESMDKLLEINNFFNAIPFKSDLEHWGQDDYWATPIEFLATQAGDCEDYTIAKYFSLIEIGIPTEKLRLIYVPKGAVGRFNQAGITAYGKI